MEFSSGRVFARIVGGLSLSAIALLSACSSDGGDDGDGGTQAECSEGSEGCSCSSEGSCDGELVCEAGVCGAKAGVGSGGGGTGGNSDGDGGTDGTGSTEGSGGASDPATGGTGSGSNLRCVGTATESCSDAACDTLPGCSASKDSSCEGSAPSCDDADGKFVACQDKWGCEFSPEGICTTQFDTKACGAKITKGSCENTDDCDWTPYPGKYCQGESLACEKIESQHCESQVGCSLVPAECEGTPTPCEEMPLDECITQPGCGVQTTSGVVEADDEATGANAKRSDLVTKKFEVYREPTDDTVDLYLDFEIINRGSLASGDMEVVFVISEDETIGNEDDREFHRVLFDEPIAPFGLDSWYVRGFLDMAELAEEHPIGFYYAGVILDSESQVAEYNEDNNTEIVLTQVYIGPVTFDLSVVSAGHDLTGTAAPGDDVTVSTVIKNSSTEPVETIPVSVFLSSDGVVDETDIQICSEIVDLNLEPGEEANVELLCPIPRLRGEYQLLVQVDPEDSLVDAKIEDNTLAASESVQVDAPSPDLVVTALASAAASADWDTQMAFSATVENTGVDAVGPSMLAFHLGGTLVCTQQVSALAPDESEVVGSGDCNLPDTLRPGDYTLSATADYQNTIFEADDGNNSFDSTPLVAIDQPPFNLKAINVQLPTFTEIVVGSSLTFAARVDNDPGAVPSPSSRITFYLSTDSSITIDDEEFCSFPLDSIPESPSNVMEFTPQCNVPVVAAGAYYVGMILDPDDELPELFEDDNVAVEDDVDRMLTVTVP